MHTFSARDNFSGYESLDSRQMLDDKIKKFWISEDFVTSDDAVLRPGEYTSIKIRLEKKLFPKQLEEIRMGMFKQLEISMRSCFAQSGIHILGNIFDYINNNISYIENLDQNGFVDIGVNVINRGLSDVEIKKDTPFFRLYFRPEQNFITGEELYDIVKSGKLKVQGEYGKTRCLVGADIFEMKDKIDFKKIDEYAEAKDLKENEVDQALTLKLFLNKNKYIPNNKNKILIQSKKDLVNVLEPLDLSRPEHANHNFNIGETCYVNLGEYFGVIVCQGYDGSGHHIISPLIDPGFQGPIRTEIVKGWEFNEFIELHIYHKDG